jgi:RHS repeat-associated protein
MRTKTAASPTDYQYTGQCSYLDSEPMQSIGFGENELCSFSRLKHDNVSYHYYVARWYDPVTAHFAQADTIIPQPGNSADWDRYAYVLYNPMRYIDPSGHLTADQIQQWTDYCTDESLKGLKDENPRLYTFLKSIHFNDLVFGFLSGDTSTVNLGFVNLKGNKIFIGNQNLIDLFISGLSFIVTRKIGEEGYVVYDEGFEFPTDYGNNIDNYDSPYITYEKQKSVSKIEQCTEWSCTIGLATGVGAGLLFAAAGSTGFGAILAGAVVGEVLSLATDSLFIPYGSQENDIVMTYYYSELTTNKSYVETTIIRAGNTVYSSVDPYSDSWREWNIYD